jgi:hypothetical protein
LRANRDAIRLAGKGAIGDAAKQKQTILLSGRTTPMADLPEYMRDLINAVPTDVVRDIVNDFRSYNPSPAMGAASKVTPVGAGRVIDGDDVKRGTTGSHGWVTPPQVDSWKPPGLREMDAMLDQQDMLDRAARAKELMEAALVQRALKETEADAKKLEKKKLEEKGSQK